MKRTCSICKEERRYDKVKLRGRYKTPMCYYCLDSIEMYIRDSIDKYGL